MSLVYHFDFPCLVVQRLCYRPVFTRAPMLNPRTNQTDPQKARRRLAMFCCSPGFHRKPPMIHSSQILWCLLPMTSLLQTATLQNHTLNRQWPAAGQVLYWNQASQSADPFSSLARLQTQFLPPCSIFEPIQLVCLGVGSWHVEIHRHGYRLSGMFFFVFGLFSGLTNFSS